MEWEQTRPGGINTTSQRPQALEMFHLWRRGVTLGPFRDRQPTADFICSVRLAHLFVFHYRGRDILLEIERVSLPLTAQRQRRRFISFMKSALDWSLSRTHRDNGG